MNMQVSQLNVNYETVGEGKDVLLLHGWGSSLSAFKGVMALLQNNYKVTALDLPGFGKSEMQKEPWSVGDYSNFVLEFINKVGLENPILVGHSYGGRIILKLCGEKKLSPEKIILIDGAGIKSKKPFKVRAKQTFFKTVKGVGKCFLWSDAGDVLTQYFRKKLGSADYNSAPEVLRKSLVMAVNEDLTPVLSNINCDTLLIYGENDTATPIREAKIIEKGVSGSAKLHIIKDAGHWAMVEKPAEVLGHIAEFLDV
ncbi:MAG: alpha/beta hydrolase [Clostridia bacterium]|nr:alpha/beta hydrolase [Clostridia bacterium]